MRALLSLALGLPVGSPVQGRAGHFGQRLLLLPLQGGAVPLQGAGRCLLCGDGRQGGLVGRKGTRGAGSRWRRRRRPRRREHGAGDDGDVSHDAWVELDVVDRLHVAALRPSLLNVAKTGVKVRAGRHDHAG